jgi:hypothetical protein
VELEELEEVWKEEVEDVVVEFEELWLRDSDEVKELFEETEELRLWEEVGAEIQTRKVQ